MKSKAFYDSIAIKQVRIAVFVALVLGVILAMVQIVVDWKKERQILENSANQLLNSLYESAAQAAYSLDYELADNVTKGLFEYQPVFRAKIVDDIGQTLSERQRPLHSSRGGKWLVNAAFGDLSYYDRILRVAHLDHPTGRMTLEIDQYLVAHDFSKRILFIVLSGITRNLVLALILGFLFHRMLTKPLLEITKALMNTDPGSGNPIMIPLPTGHETDELGELSKTMNQQLNRFETVLIRQKETEEELRNSEDALRKSEERFELAMKFVNDGLFDWNLETNQIYYSSGWKSMLGYQDHEIKNEFSEWERLTRPEDVRSSMEMLDSLLNGEINRFENEFQMKHKDGYWVDILSRANVIFNENNKGIRVVGTHVDITERKRAEEKLKQYSDHLEEMVKERTQELESAQKELLLKERLAILGNFAGSMAHEIRNPLAAIDSTVYLLKLKMKNEDEKVLQLFGRISSNVKKSTDIIESLLNLSKMKKPKTERHNLSYLASGIVTRFSMPDSVEVIMDCSENTVFVDVDVEQMRMAITNVLTNAVQSMNGEGKIITSVRPLDTGYAELSVTDSGPGIPPEHLEKIFEPLFSTKASGIGFGLSLTKLIIEKHGGTVSAETQSGGGATIIFTLPTSKDKG